MAKNANFVSHKKSKLKNQDGSPQLPLASALVEGEIAINFGKDVETLSIKNESGDVVTFSSDNYYTEQKLGSGFTGENSAVTVTQVIDEIDLVTSTALNDLEERKQNILSAGTGIDITNDVISVTGGGSITVDQVIDSGTSASTNAVSTSAVYEVIRDNEYVVSQALNDLESRKLDTSAYTPTVELWVSGTGLNSVAQKGGNNTASGDYGSHSEGNRTTASGQSSHAEGNYTTAGGNYSHAEGNNTTASGSDSHAEGYNTTASGHYSHAEGNSTTANNQSEHASGQYNVSNSASTTFGNSGNTLFSVGNGTADNARHNAFEIKQNGDIYIVSGNSDIKLQDYIGGGGSITVDQVLDNTTSASTNPVSSKAVYDAVTDNELVWTNAFVTLSSVTSAHTADTSIHITSADRIKLDSITGTVGTMAYENTSSYSSATEVNTALGGKANTATTLAGYGITDAYTKTEVDARDLWVSGTGINSVAQKGGNNTASGNYSHAEGSYAKASSYASHAEGSSTSASSNSSHAEGYSALASGDYSHAEGRSTKASNTSSHAEGYYTTASGTSSHAEGNNTTAGSQSSHAEGASTIANGFASHAEGNKTSATTDYSHAEGYSTTASGDSSHAEGTSTIANSYASHAEGDSTSATSNSSHAEGWKTLANGASSHAEGSHTIASGGNSHAEGSYTTASGTISHAEGMSTTASGGESHAEGQNTTASGVSSHAEGSYTTANGDSSHAEGYNTTASGQSSHAEGYNTKANNQSEHASGQYNVSSKASSTFGDGGNTLFSVGNGTASYERHNAFEIRQNGDIYITSGGTNTSPSIKLQDSLGGTIDQTIDSTTSASTNAVSTSAVYTQMDGLKFKKITQSAYDQLQTKDPNTLYFITD